MQEAAHSKCLSDILDQVFALMEEGLNYPPAGIDS